MSEIERITDYDINLRLILEQYKKSVNLLGVLSSENDQADDLETALFEIRDLFYLETAEGLQLDIIGIIFGVERCGRTDTEYRAAISAKSAIAGSGEPESIIEILLALFDATFVRLYQGFEAIVPTPAAYYLDTDAVITRAEIERFSPAGVGIGFLAKLIDANGNYIVDANGNNIIVTTGVNP